jgi:hypothetical protein
VAANPTANDLPARRGKRAALAIFVALAAAFILSSTWQIWNQVFGFSSSGATASKGCSMAAQSFEEQIDRALTMAARMHSPESAKDEFNSSLQNGVGLASVEKRCVEGPADRDTYVAAARLHETALAAAQEEAAVLARVRRALEARSEK